MGSSLADPRAGLAQMVPQEPEEPQDPEHVGQHPGVVVQRYQRTAAARLPASTSRRSHSPRWLAPRSGSSACSASARK